MNELSATSEAALLMGGEEVEVKYRDKGKETVLVRDLPVKFYPKLFEALEDEEKQAEIYCDRPAGWAATLTGASLNAVMKAGEALNKENFFDWCARRFDLKKRQDVVMAPLREAMKAAVEAAQRSGNSAIGSQKSAN